MTRLRRYIETMVNPTIEDFEANPQSVRLAFLTCVVVFHCVDYVSRPRKPGNLRETFRRKSHAFAAADRIAHAFKHVTSDGQERLGAEEIISRPPLAYGVSGAYGLSRYGDGVGGVTLCREREMDILRVVKRVRDFVRDYSASSLGNGVRNPHLAD
jgi:hypothetical protein